MLNHELATNIIDSLREATILTIAGIIVYKMDHHEAANRLSKMTGMGRDKALGRIAETRLIPAEHMLDEAVSDIAKLAQRRLDDEPGATA